MASLEELRQLVGEILDLGDRASSLQPSTRLLGSLPELDSMAVVAIITELEERYAIVIEDDDIDATIFDTLGSLLDFVNMKSAA